MSHSLWGYLEGGRKNTSQIDEHAQAMLLIFEHGGQLRLTYHIPKCMGYLLKPLSCNVDRKPFCKLLLCMPASFF